MVKISVEANKKNSFFCVAAGKLGNNFVSPECCLVLGSSRWLFEKLVFLVPVWFELWTVYACTNDPKQQEKRAPPNNLNTIQWIDRERMSEPDSNEPSYALCNSFSSFFGCGVWIIRTTSEAKMRFPFKLIQVNGNNGCRQHRKSESRANRTKK